MWVAPKESIMAEKKEAKTVTARDLATKLKIEPKRLRAILRANGMHAKDGHYEWKQDDAALDKIAHMIVEERKAAKKS
jgi:phage antirepressor YoqD-like protein